ncbi:MAG: hypothetical protein COY58_01045 [Gammaproteobacteria bacterium CG_4_10_14_0_8_um_filter_38_16]|nr:MAG: hypothetical protein COY58_01045 [Gammaproteobacteria bacterium CG_4_10_14_0_8_um_filter_38_16]PJA03232.1 MAG: hypothetical protein COX72_06045 [Gammaproteobacteria bacterium CG_4_10_14_0_2_um_filter_38_22]PJB10896.1 MAG: hypothetical protein CO120_02460 [Gammaproteobacteria bacterium CG_4_9_14_3_um_filter_38_9]
MKKILFLFLILLTAIGIGFLIHKNPGYVIVSYEGWIVTTSIWIALITLFLAFCVLYFFMRAIKNIALISKRLAHRKKFKFAQKYQRCITQGITSIAQGEFKNAEKYFLKSNHYAASFTNYLLAAKAAHDEQRFEKRDDYLQKALAIDPKARFAITLSQARFYLESDQIDEALGILKQLYQKEPKNKLILSSLKSVYMRTNDTQAMHFILPQLKKYKLISTNEIAMLNSKM